MSRSADHPRPDHRRRTRRSRRAAPAAESLEGRNLLSSGFGFASMSFGSWGGWAANQPAAYSSMPSIGPGDKITLNRCRTMLRTA